jgi:hypothetical protein
LRKKYQDAAALLVLFVDVLEESDLLDFSVELFVDFSEPPLPLFLLTVLVLFEEPLL